MEKQTRTIAYVRVSTAKQADHGVSLETQQEKVRAYASLYDLELVDVAVEAAASAKTLDRPVLSEVLGRLARGEVDALLVVKLDRLTRSVTDLGTLIERCNRQGWALLSVSEQIDTRTAAGRLVLNVLASVSQWEREAIGERTAEALRHKRSRGEFTGGEPPYGWQLGTDGVHLEPNDGERAVIDAARELRAAGLSLRKVGAALVERGALPRRGTAWNPKTVRSLICSQVLQSGAGR